MECPTCSQEIPRVFSPGTFVERIFPTSSLRYGVVVGKHLDKTSRVTYPRIIQKDEIVWVDFKFGEIHSTSPKYLKILKGHFHIGSKE